MTITDTDIAYLRQAYRNAALSHDPSTQNGSVLVSSNGVEAWGWNAFAEGLAETPERWERPAKYDYIVHAEVAAILDAASSGIKTYGATLYCPWFACVDCARTIIAAGVARVVGHRRVLDFGDLHSPSWTASIARADAMLDEVGVKRDYYYLEIPSAPAIRVGGQIFDPAKKL